VRAPGALRGTRDAAGRPVPAATGLGGERAPGAGERAEHASDTVPAAAAEPACPACEYASDLTRAGDPTVAFCAGVARALAATERRVVSFPFHFCRTHRAIVCKKTQEAVEGEGSFVHGTE
jgi:hypothetical protein